jgi:ATP-dependent DNA helicase RecG
MMRLAIDEMYLSVPEENSDEEPPFVGAAILLPDDKQTFAAQRGQFSEGDHAEFTLLDKTLRAKKLDGA